MLHLIMMLRDRRGSGYELRPVYGAPGTEGASGATGYKGPTGPQWPVLFLGKKGRREGGT